MGPPPGPPIIPIILGSIMRGSIIRLPGPIIIPGLGPLGPPGPPGIMGPSGPIPIGYLIGPPIMLLGG